MNLVEQIRENSGLLVETNISEISNVIYDAVKNDRKEDFVEKRLKSITSLVNYKSMLNGDENNDFIIDGIDKNQDFLGMVKQVLNYIINHSAKEDFKNPSELNAFAYKLQGKDEKGKDFLKNNSGKNPLYDRPLKAPLYDANDNYHTTVANFLERVLLRAHKGVGDRAAQDEKTKEETAKKTQELVDKRHEEQTKKYNVTQKAYASVSTYFNY